MATILHPLTGDELNPIPIKRKNLSYENAVTVWVMKLQGETFTDIVQKLGTNANRVGEVLRGDVHKSANNDALAIMQENKLMLF